ncbi:MAG: sensor histidine kinase [Thermoanaerobaculia bacterium]
MTAATPSNGALFPQLAGGAIVLIALVLAGLALRRRKADRVAAEARAREEWRQAVETRDVRITEQEILRDKILDGIGEGVVALDRRRNVALANRRAVELLGLREPVVGSPAYQAVRNAAVHAAFDAALRGVATTRLVTIERGPEERHVNLHVTPVTGSHEIAAVALFVDVTRVSRLERVRRDFLTDFSHEVRTPLAGLRSAAETLERGGVSAADEQRLRAIVARQLDRLERLVDDLAELNRIEAGDLQLRKQPVDLAVLLRDVAADFRERAAQRSVALECGTEPAVAEIDPQRVQQIVSNLVDNAIKFSPPGGLVRLESSIRGPHAIVAVHDSGEGIPPGERERIFHRFYRIDKSRSQEVPGMGLGLAIVKHLTALHGGTVEVTSEPGKGSRFTVILPAGSESHSGRNG